MPEKTKQRFQIEIAGTIDAVWHEITRTDAPIPAFFNSQMHVARLAPGAKLAMRTGDGRYTGVVGEILEFDPPRRFAHTFRFTNHDDPPCKVIYELEPTVTGVRFTLSIEDLVDGTKSAKSMIQGSKLILATLKSVIETGRPSFGTRLLFGLFKVLQPLSPKRCRSEHWPIDR